MEKASSEREKLVRRSLISWLATTKRKKNGWQPLSEQSERSGWYLILSYYPSFFTNSNLIQAYCVRWFCFS
jgi:hypothetical protein